MSDRDTDRNHRIVDAVQRRGRPYAEIAMIYRISIPRVSQIVAKYGSPREIPIKVSQSTFNRLAEEATRRGTNPQALVRSLLAIIATDGLFNAILEEAE